MRNIEKIKAEIERQRSLIEGLFIEGDNSFYDGQNDAYNHLLAFIDSLPDENNPEPYNPVYDEDYLNGKIDKAKKSWEGVDVDKFMNEVRGRDEEPSKDLEEAAEEYALLFNDGTKWKDGGKYKGFIAGAEWQKEQDVRDMYMSDNRNFLKCYEQGKKDMKQQMMKDAVEGEVVKDMHGFFRIKSECIDGARYKFGDWVKLIIVKNEE